MLSVLTCHEFVNQSTTKDRVVLTCAKEQRTQDTTTKPNCSKQRMARPSWLNTSSRSAQHLCISQCICHTLKVIFPPSKFLPFKSNGHKTNVFSPFYQDLFLFILSGSVSSIKSSHTAPNQDNNLPHLTIPLWSNWKLIFFFPQVQVAVRHQPPFFYKLLTKRYFLPVYPLLLSIYSAAWSQTETSKNERKKVGYS